MRLLHTTKSKAKKAAPNEIPINTEAALAPQAFATYTDEENGQITHRYVGWRLPVPLDGGRQAGHVYELVIGPEAIDRAIEALQKAKERFAQPTIPGESRSDMHPKLEVANGC